MKKRILGLALALVMIISLLPLTAIAADTPMPKFRMYDPAYATYLESYFNASKTVYVVYENVYDTDGTTVIGNKPLLATAPPSDNYVKYEYADGVATITLKNVNYKRTASAGAFISILPNSGYTNEFDVVLVLEGTNSIECPNDLSDNKYENCDACIIMEHAGNTTITGTGSLTANVPLTGNTFFWTKKAGDMKIENVTLDFYLPNTNNGSIAGICVNGAISIEGANVTIDGYGYSDDDGAPTTALKAKMATLITGSKATSRIDDTTKGITFSKGAVVELTSGSTTPVQTKGAIVVDNATVTMQKGTGNQSPFASSMPTVTGCDSVELKKNTGSSPSYKDASNYDIAAGTALTTTEKLVGFKTVHTCAAQADDGDCTTAIKCACGKEVVAAKQHIAGANADDCTKDTICGNEGCTQVYAAKLGDAHTPGADDGDCTTDIKCANCDQVATKGAEKHVWDRTSCDVDGACTTAGCTKTVAAGTHTGGTATCKDKAKCEECGKEYGELGGCVPAADDGDCTTDIKCSLCGKTTTAGEAAHKYTDKNDTTCDNAGCTNTRKVEGTENPKTGDNTALVLMVSLMAVAAAAFVTSKKFAR